MKRPFKARGAGTGRRYEAELTDAVWQARARGLTYQQIADRLGVSKKTVEYRLRQARVRALEWQNESLWKRIQVLEAQIRNLGATPVGLED